MERKPLDRFGWTLLVVFALSVIAFAALATWGQEREQPKATYATFPPIEGTYWFLMDRVTDGDTAKAYLLVPVNLRFYGIQADEIHDKDPEKRKSAQKAKEAVEGRMKYGWRFRGKVYGHDDFGRVLTTPFDDNGESIPAWLLANNFAREWRAK